MPDKPLRMLLAKGHCQTCQSPVSVEVEEPAPLVVSKTEPCRCGLTENVRIVRYVVFGFTALFMVFFGSCVSNHFFTNQAIKEMKGQFEVKEKVAPLIENTLPFEVVPKSVPKPPGTPEAPRK